MGVVKKEVTCDETNIIFRFYNFTSLTYDRFLSGYIDGSYYGDVTLPAGATECTFTFMFLDSGRTYSCNFDLYSSKGTIANYGPYSYTTLDPYYHNDTVAISVASKTSNSITVNITGATLRNYERDVYVSCYKDNVRKTSVSSSLSAYKSYIYGLTLSGLDYSTEYKIEVELVNPDGTDNASNYTYETTESQYSTNDTGTLKLTASYGELYVYIDKFTERLYPRTLQFKCYSGSESYTGEVYYSPVYANEPEYTFSGLTGNKSYTIKVVSYNPDGTKSYTATSSEYVPAYYSTDSATYRSVVGVETITLILENITSRSYPRTVVFTWKNNSTGKSGSKKETLSSKDTSVSVDMENLIPGTSYTFSITMTNPAGTTTYTSGEFKLTTNDYNYTLTISSFATSNTVGVDIKLSSVQDFDIPIKVYLDGERELSDTISAGATTLKKTYISNINPATSYNITVYDSKRQKNFYFTKRTKNNFKWSTNVASGEEFSLLATDWNEYISQLKKKAEYFGYTDYSPSDVSKGNTFTAVKFNGAATVINWLVDNKKGDCKTSIASGKEKGNGILASDILALATCLNE